MKSENVVKYIDEYIQHIIDFSTFGNQFSKEIAKEKDRTVLVILDTLKKSGALITKTYANSIRTKINEELDLLESRLQERIEEAVASVVLEENAWLLGPLSDFLNIQFDIKPSDEDKLLKAPVAYAGIIQDFSKNIVNKYRSLFYDMIAASYITGSVLEEVEQGFTSRKTAIDRGVVVESETLGSSIGTQYDRIVFTRNADKITGYIWSAILDKSTCIVCGSLDGKNFTNITKVPIYPVHPNCRCVLIPYTEDIKDAIPESYTEWFDRQNKTVQKHILGPKRFQLYEKGMKIKEFINNGHITLLKDLKK